jgi:hypothetical protein
MHGALEVLLYWQNSCWCCLVSGFGFSLVYVCGYKRHRCQQYRSVKGQRDNTAISHVAGLLTNRSMSLWFPFLYLVHAH